MTISTRTVAFAGVLFAALGAVATPSFAVDVLYVIGGSQAADGLSRPGDILVNDFFVNRGDTVTLMDENDDAAAMLAASDAASLTYISESVGSGNVTNKVTASTTPVITSEAFLQDDLLFTLNDDCCRTNVDGVMDVEIADPTHPMAAGLSGVVSVIDQAGTIARGTPGGDAMIIATLAGDAADATIYAYDTGGLLNDGSAAAARRIFMGSMTGLTLAPDPVWTAEGEALFGAAVDYALVPEPTSVMLLAMGLAGLLGFAWRKRA